MKYVESIRGLRKFLAQYWQAAFALIIIGSVGVVSLLTSHAGTPTAQIEVENGTVAGNAATISDISASADTAVRFNAPNTYRLPFIHPYAQDSPYNTPLAVTATYESANDEKSAWINAKSTSGTINSVYWSVNMAQAKVTDPLVTVTHKSTGAVLAANIRVPADFQPPQATGTLTPDANSVIVQSDGYTAYEFYKFEKFSDTDWRATRVVKQDLRAGGITSGIRACGNSLANGLIRATEATAGSIPHALAISIPETGLKLTPLATDGQVSSNGKAVWPCNTQDTQVPGQLEYSGPIPMGTLFALPQSFNVSSLGLSGSALAVAKAAQQYGVFVTDRSSSIALYAEPTTASSDVTAIKAAWKQIIPQLRRVTNETSTNVGGGTGSVQRLAPLAPPFDPSIPGL